MGTELTNATCLFTGDALIPQTEEEHTLLRALGGRIRSRIVSSSSFNHRCGETLDTVLASVYAVHMNVLAPLLSTQHETGFLAVKVPNDPNAFCLDEGALIRRGISVLSRDKKGKPRTAIASDMRSLEELARQVGVEKDWHISSAPATGSNSFLYDCPAIRPELEVAVLKGSLLTFDHLLRDDPNRFTRSASLAQVREFIQKAVNEKKVHPEMCHRFSLGMQYDRLPLYRELRKAIAFAETPFEHFLLVAGNGPARCIDVVWIVLGFDPFGFRVAHDWDGGSFAIGIVNGVVKDSGVSMAIPLVAPDDLLCHPTNLRSCLEDSVPARGVADIQEIVSRRCAALKEVEYLVDMEAPDALRYNLVQSALCDLPHQRSIGTQIIKRLQGWYARTVSEAQLKRALADVLRRNSRGELKAMLRRRIQDELATNVTWPSCLSIYRACLADLRKQFGLPVDVLVEEKCIEQLEKIPMSD